MEGLRIIPEPFLLGDRTWDRAGVPANLACSKRLLAARPGAMLQ